MGTGSGGEASTVTTDESSLLSSLVFALEGSKRTHDETGYWGPPNSIHQFCEPHYAVTPWIAEFYNTVSSFLFTAVAIYALYYEPRFRKDPYVLAAFIFLAAIGLGSAAFHATMRYNMQLCDEIPMVCYVTCLLLGNVTLRHPLLAAKPSSTSAEKTRMKASQSLEYYYPHPWIPNATASMIWVVLTLSMSMSIVAVYVALEQYEMFLAGFTVVVLVHMTVVLRSPLHVNYGNQQLFLRYMSLGFILAGKSVWEIEHRLCGVFPNVYPLHVIWHIFSCISAYFGALALYVLRQPPLPQSKSGNSNGSNGSSYLYLNVWGYAPPKFSYYFYPSKTKKL